MKKQCVAALCAAGLALAAIPAQAAEFRPYGSLEFTWQWDSNVDPTYPFMDSADAKHNLDKPFHQKVFRPQQRFIFGTDIIISENLSATYDGIAGFNTWGGPSSGVMPYPQMSGNALGTRANNLVTRSAFIDWTVPNTKIKLRIGLQNFFLPGFATGSLPVKPEFGTGIVATAPITDNLTGTFMWLRAASGPRRGTSTTFPSDKYTDDTMDLMVLRLPYKGDGYRFAPYVSLGIMGKDSFAGNIKYSTATPYSANVVGQGYPHFTGLFDRGFTPVYGASVSANLVNGTQYTPGTIYPYWIGFGGEWTKNDPFRFGFDMAYGGTKTEHGHKMFSRGGWYGGLQLSYKTQYGVPTMKAWYSTGDDSNIQNGSERPTHWSLGNANTGLLNSSGFYNITLGMEAGNLMGTWGFSLQWNNFSPVSNLFASLRLAYFQGTNAPAMAPYVRQALTAGTVTLNPTTHRPTFEANHGVLPIQWYMTTKDSLIELDFETIYSIQKNLAAMFEVNYIIPNFDSKIWGADFGGKFHEMKTSNPWRVAVSLRYTF